jgi:hypothetical protein
MGMRHRHRDRAHLGVAMTPILWPITRDEDERLEHYVYWCEPQDCRLDPVALHLIATFLIVLIVEVGIILALLHLKGVL